MSLTIRSNQQNAFGYIGEMTSCCLILVDVRAPPLDMWRSFKYLSYKLLSQSDNAPIRGYGPAPYPPPQIKLSVDSNDANNAIERLGSYYFTSLVKTCVPLIRTDSQEERSFSNFVFPHIGVYLQFFLVSEGNYL